MTGVEGGTRTRAVLAVTYAACAAIVRIEPTAGDSWRGVTWLARNGWRDLPHQLWWTYTHFNPRLGEAWLYLASAAPLVHVILTPAMIVAMVVAVVALATGRIPRAGDGGLVVAAIALVCIGVSRIGEDVFYLAYATNYVYGFAIQAWYLLAIRLRLDTTGPSPRRWLAAGGMLVAGIAAGLCNEHTGPTLIVAYGALGAVLVRRRRAVWPWVVAGAIGVVAGYLALYLAPGNAVRDSGKGAASAVARIAAHGPLGAVRVLALFAQEAAGGLVVLAIVGAYHLRRRTVPRTAWWSIAAATAIALTLLGSPRWVGRLFLAPGLLVVVAIVAMLDRMPVRRLALRFAAAIAIVHAIGFFTVQADQHADYAARDAILRRTPPGEVPVVAPVRHWASVHWAFGDDLRFVPWRTWIAEQYGLPPIELTPATR